MSMILYHCRLTSASQSSAGSRDTTKKHLQLENWYKSVGGIYYIILIYYIMLKFSVFVFLITLDVHIDCSTQPHGVKIKCCICLVGMSLWNILQFLLLELCNSQCHSWCFLDLWSVIDLFPSSRGLELIWSSVVKIGQSL